MRGLRQLRLRSRTARLRRRNRAKLGAQLRAKLRMSEIFVPRLCLARASVDGDELTAERLRPLAFSFLVPKRQASVAHIFAEKHLEVVALADNEVALSALAGAHAVEPSVVDNHDAIDVDVRGVITPGLEAVLRRCRNESAALAKGDVAGMEEERARSVECVRR